MLPALVSSTAVCRTGAHCAQHLFVSVDPTEADYVMGAELELNKLNSLPLRAPLEHLFPGECPVFQYTITTNSLLRDVEMPRVSSRNAERRLISR
jgi:hypothetical protein